MENFNKTNIWLNNISKEELTEITFMAKKSNPEKDVQISKEYNNLLENNEPNKNKERTFSDINNDETEDKEKIKEIFTPKQGEFKELDSEKRNALEEHFEQLDKRNQKLVSRLDAINTKIEELQQQYGDRAENMSFMQKMELMGKISNLEKEKQDVTKDILKTAKEQQSVLQTLVNDPAKDNIFWDIDENGKKVLNKDIVNEYKEKFNNIRNRLQENQATDKKIKDVNKNITKDVMEHVSDKLGSKLDSMGNALEALAGKGLAANIIKFIDNVFKLLGFNKEKSNILDTMEKLQKIKDTFIKDKNQKAAEVFNDMGNKLKALEEKSDKLLEPAVQKELEENPLIGKEGAELALLDKNPEAYKEVLKGMGEITGKDVSKEIEDKVSLKTDKILEETKLDKKNLDKIIKTMQETAQELKETLAGNSKFAMKAVAQKAGAVFAAKTGGVIDEKTAQNLMFKSMNGEDIENKDKEQLLTKEKTKEMAKKAKDIGKVAMKTVGGA